MAIFGLPSAHVTISHYLRVPPPPPTPHVTRHWVNNDKLSLRIQVAKTIWGHFKNSNDTRNHDKSEKLLK